MRPLLNSNLLVVSSRRLRLIVSLLLSISGLSYGQLPPAPPGFMTQPTTKLQSPKAISSTSGSLMVKPPSGLLVGASIISTNHQPPVASIRWAFAPPGSVEVDPSLTNVVPCRLLQGRQFNQAIVGIEWVGLAGKTYEVQFIVDNLAWLTYMRLTPQSDGIQTAWCGINTNEPCRYFRIRSN